MEKIIVIFLVGVWKWFGAKSFIQSFWRSSRTELCHFLWRPALPAWGWDITRFKSHFLFRSRKSFVVHCKPLWYRVHFSHNISNAFKFCVFLILFMCVFVCVHVCVCTLSSSQGDTPSLHPPNAGAHLHRCCRRLHLQQIENTSFSNLLKDSDFWASIVFVFHCDICAHRTRGYEWRQNKHNHSYYEAYKIKRHNDLTYTLNLYYEPEMQKAADVADISVLFFQLVLIFGPFWVILAILGHFWANLGNFGSFLGCFG